MTPGQGMRGYNPSQGSTQLWFGIAREWPPGT